MENKSNTKIYAKINLNGKTELVLINEDLEKRERIIKELWMMAMETIFDFNLLEPCEYDDIRLVIDTKIEEFEELMIPIILNHFNKKLNSNQILVFLEGFQMSKEDLANGIVMNYDVQIITKN